MAITNFVVPSDSDKIILRKESEIKQRYEFLPPGFYSPFVFGDMFHSQRAFTPVPERENLIKFETGVFKNVMDVVSNFFSRSVMKKYSELRVAHKMGMILYGPHGTGKTSLAQLAMREMVNKYNALCFDCTSRGIGFIIDMVSIVRNIQKNPIIIFVDEVDHAIKQQEEDYLSFLDGTDSFNNTIFLGCTNKLHDMPKRIIDRKSRIKYLFEVKALPMQIYIDYLKDKIKALPDKEVSKFSYLAEEAGLTIDQFKHSIIDFYIEDIEMEYAIKKAKEISPSSDEENAL